MSTNCRKLILTINLTDELQKKLMTSITTMIWHEKIRYDMDEMLNGNVKHEGWVVDPRTGDNVTRLMNKADAASDPEVVVYTPGMCHPVDSGAD